MRRHHSSVPTLLQILARVHIRLILCAVLMAGIAVTIVGVGVMRSYADQNLKLTASSVAYAIEPALMFEDVQAVRDGVAAVAGSECVRSVEVHDRDGRVVLVWERPGTGIGHAMSRLFGYLLWRAPVSTQVLHGNAVIGTVRLTGDAGGIGGYIVSGVGIALACLILIVLAMRLLARRLQRDVTEPLARIAMVAHAVRIDRQFDRRIPAAGIAEVDQLGQDINALLDELETWHAGLLSEKRALEVMATRDPLTGLGNRAMFNRSIEEATATAERTHQPFGMMYVDVDRFKQVNDGHGHDAGDAILIVIAARLRAALNPGDLAFRLGGDEFALILAPGTTEPVVSALMDRITESMRQPVMLPSGDSIKASLSVGAALYPQDSADPRGLLRHADAAMYAAKGQGRQNGTY